MAECIADDLLRIRSEAREAITLAEHLDPCAPVLLRRDLSTIPMVTVKRIAPDGTMIRLLGLSARSSFA